MNDVVPYKTKRKLGNMLNNMTKREKEKKSIFPITGIYIFSELIKKQNEETLKNIAKDKIKNEDEKEMFIDKYWKLNYQIPDIVEDHKKEEMQKYI